MKSSHNGVITKADPRALMPESDVRTLASNIFDHLRREGCNPKDIICVSSQLLSLVTTEIKNSSQAAP